MKKNIAKIFVLSFVLILGISVGASAQNYHSKPTAVKNLSDEAKYLASTLPSLEENNAAMYKVNSEKLRFIKATMSSLKKGATVEEAANATLPKEELHIIQPSVRFIDVSFANMTPREYIRSEVLFLITY